MKLLLSFLLCLNGVLCFSQGPNNLIKLNNTPSPGDTSYIGIKYDSVAKEFVLGFKSAKLNELLDTVEKYWKFTIKNTSKSTPPPITCAGALPLRLKPLDVLHVICEEYNYAIEQVSRNTYSVREGFLYFRDFLRYNAYTTDVKRSDTSWTKIYYDTVKKYHVIDFKSVSPYHLLKQQAEANGFEVKVDRYIDQDNVRVSGTLPLYMKSKVILDHFCAYHNHFKFKSGKVHVITNNHEFSLSYRELN